MADRAFVTLWPTRAPVDSPPVLPPQKDMPMEPPGGEPLDRAAESRRVQHTLEQELVHQRWESDFRIPANERFYDRAFDYIARALGPAGDATVLDAGCGKADYAIRLARRGFRVVGVDFSPPVLQTAERNVQASDVRDRITVQRASILELPFADNRFDHVLCWGVLMHIPDVSTAINQLARVVKPGGNIVISETNMFSIESMSRRALRRLLRPAQMQGRRTPAGLERWARTAAGDLLTREADPAWLVEAFRGAGCDLRSRVAGQFTELYITFPGPVAGMLIHGWNRLWFQYVRLPQPAMDNLYVFTKRR
jgi:2-polyprenyl-3-methyl-5-hydroxy-6-metoxy-1,4-benzoquinol methylase